MGGRLNWSRNRDRIRSRDIETLTGDDFSALLPQTRKPRPRPPSKDDLRRQAEQAVKDFQARKSKPDEHGQRAPSAPGPDEPPPWEDDSE